MATAAGQTNPPPPPPGGTQQPPPAQPAPSTQPAASTQPAPSTQPAASTQPAPSTQPAQSAPSGQSNQDYAAFLMGAVMHSTPRRSRPSSKKNRSVDESVEEEEDVFFTPQTSTSRQLRIDHTMDETSNIPSSAQIRNMKVQMISNAVSVIMLLAAGQEPDAKRMEMAKTYLNCVTDDFGQHSPNVRGMLNHILQIEKGNVTLRTVTKAKFPAQAPGGGTPAAGAQPPPSPPAGAQPPPSTPAGTQPPPAAAAPTKPP